MPFFYGWVMVAVAALASFFSGIGQTFSLSVFVNPILAEFGWSRSLVSGLYSLASLLGGPVMTPIGRAVDRLGNRRVMTGVALLFGGGCLLMSQASSVFTVFGGFFATRLLGQGSLSLLATNLVAQWFRRHRGRALAFAAIGAALASAILPRFNLWLGNLAGWRTPWLLWAVLLWLLMLPAAALLVRSRPEEVGLHPDNRPPDPAAGSGNDPVPEHAFTLREAMATRTFWVLLLGTSLPPLTVAGISFHLISVLGQRGISPEASAGAFVISSLAYLPCTMLAGYVADRLPVRILVVAWLAIQATEVFWILYAPLPLLVAGFGLLFGILQALYPMVGGTLWVSYYGRRHLGSIQGFAMTASVAGAALGPLAYGIVFDLAGRYSPVMLTMAGLELATAVVVATMAHPPRQPSCPAVAPRKMQGA